MSDSARHQRFSIGWDVGGWNCDRNYKSRDAIVILDAERNIIGTPWRGNLRTTINEADTTQDWLVALFAHCDVDWPAGDARVILAIDTPLGFSRALLQLLTQQECEGPIEQSATNPYLFRDTERFLFDHGLRPLSPIKDMIGSQATKGIHVLAKFAPNMSRCGVWADGVMLTAIEAYPSACDRSGLFKDLLAQYVVDERADTSERLCIEQIDHQDISDALTCALVAHVFASQPEVLANPPDSTPKSEGWIWAPTDALQIDPHRRVVIA